MDLSCNCTMLSWIEATLVFCFVIAIYLIPIYRWSKKSKPKIQKVGAVE